MAHDTAVPASKRKTHIRWLLNATCAAFLAGFLFLPASRTAAPTAFATSLRPGLRVATINMYLGFDLTPLVNGQNDTTDALAMRSLVDRFFDRYRANEPAKRIAALANELARAAPDVIGLQEAVSLSLNGFSLGDYVSELLSGIRDAGGPGYDVVVFDAMAFRGDLGGGRIPLNVDFRDREAVLFRKELRCKAIDGGHAYKASRKAVAVLGSPVTLNRGVVGVLCGASPEKSFYLFDTHLDVGSQASVQEAQAAEFADYVKTVTRDRSLPIIVTGDFNAHEDVKRTQTYAFLTGRGFVDSYRERYPDRESHPGYTCCQEDALANVDSVAGARYDYVFHAGERLVAKESQVFADQPVLNEDGSGPRWVSDHFGVWTDFDWQ